MLLAGAIAFYTLLSLLPILLILTVTLSQFIAPEVLTDTSRTFLSFLIPEERTEMFLKEAYQISHSRNLTSFLSLVTLLFFSSMVFRVLQRAIFTFFGKPSEHRRNRSTRMMLPYLLVVLLVAGFSLSVVLNSLVHSLKVPDSPYLQELVASLPQQTYLTQTLLFLSEVALLTLIYKILAPVKIDTRNAIIASLGVTLLWSIIQGMLGWYYSAISQLSVLFGTFSTLVVILLTLEIAAIILLLGTQFIVDMERRNQA
jgi:YihY family inner membrane protein